MNAIGATGTGIPLAELFGGATDRGYLAVDRAGRTLLIDPCTVTGKWFVGTINAMGKEIDCIRSPVSNRFLTYAIQRCGFDMSSIEYGGFFPAEPSETNPRFREPITDQRKRTTDWVYFIQASIGGPIKIGCAMNVNARVATFQLGCPFELVVLAVLPFEALHEKAIHKKFAAERLHGEWFSPSVRLLSFIREIQSGKNNN